MSSPGTPFPFSCTLTLNSTNILSYSAFITSSTPVTPTSSTTNQGWKRKEKKNLLPTHFSLKKAKIDLTWRRFECFMVSLNKNLAGLTVKLCKTSASLANLNKSHKAALYPPWLWHMAKIQLQLESFTSMTSKPIFFNEIWKLVRKTNWILALLPCIMKLTAMGSISPSSSSKKVWYVAINHKVINFCETH